MGKEALIAQEDDQHLTGTTQVRQQRGGSLEPYTGGHKEAQQVARESGELLGLCAQW